MGELQAMQQLLTGVIVQSKKKEKLKDDGSFLIIHLTFRSTEVLLTMNYWDAEGFDDISFIESK